MAESTVTKSRVFKEDLAIATGATGAEESGTRITSTGGEVTLTKLDATHIPFQAIAGTIDDLVDGGQDITIKPGSITMDGTLTNDADTSAGYVKNSASGVYSGGNSISTADLPSAIPASNIADGSVSDTEFQYLNGVTSNIQTQLNAATVAASQAEQETATETAKYVSPAKQQYHPSAAKAWVYVTGAGTPARAAYYNVSSITDSDVGQFIVVFTTAFSSANYGMAGVCNKDGVVGPHATTDPEVGQIAVTTWDSNDGTIGDYDHWGMVFFGDQ